jgi:hypothetical protein
MIDIQETPLRRQGMVSHLRVQQCGASATCSCSSEIIPYCAPCHPHEWGQRWCNGAARTDRPETLARSNPSGAPIPRPEPPGQTASGPTTPCRAPLRLAGGAGAKMAFVLPIRNRFVTAITPGWHTSPNPRHGSSRPHATGLARQPLPCIRKPWFGRW